MLPLTTGVPQGSILGPLLFIIYMNDIHRACKHFHPILFADDTNLTSYLCIFNEELNTPDRMISLSQVINNELKEIQKWLELNKLSLNVKKTKYIIFHNHQRGIINHTPKLELNGEPLVRGSLNPLKAEDIFKIKIIKFYYKYSQKTLPLYFNEMFTKTSDQHNHGTRQQSAQILYKYPTRTDIGRKCIRHLLREIVNKTQSCITEKVSTHSFNGFTTYIKKHMISNYSEHCHIENCYICHKQN